MTDAIPPIPDPSAPDAAAPEAAPAAAPQAPTAPPAPAPYGQQQPYAQPGYTQAYAPNSYGPRTNVLAIISLVASLAGLFVWLLAPVAGIVMGHIAMNQIKRTGEGGRSLAVAGTIIGYVLAGLQVLFIIAYIIIIAVAASSGAIYGTTVH